MCVHVRGASAQADAPFSRLQICAAHFTARTESVFVGTVAPTRSLRATSNGHTIVNAMTVGMRSIPPGCVESLAEGIGMPTLWRA